MFSSGPHSGITPGSRAVVRAITVPPQPAARSQKPSPSRQSPVEAPIRARPTETWDYRWLGAGVVGGLVAGIGCGIGIATLSTMLIAANASNAAIVFAVGLATIRGVRPLVSYLRFDSMIAKQRDASDMETQRRMERIVDSLCLKAEKVINQVIPACNFKELMAIWDGPKNHNILGYDRRFASLLDDRQLEAMVAHEISHADRHVNGWLKALHGLSKFATTTAGFGSFWYAISDGTGTTSAVAFALGSFFLTRAVIRTCFNIASRAEEIRTDIRSVELTGDLGSWVQAFDTIQHHTGLSELPKFIQILNSLSTHPSVSMRERWLRSACGNPKSA